MIYLYHYDLEAAFRVVVRPEEGKSAFSLAAIINGWLEGRHSPTVKIILPILISPEEMLRQLGEAVRNAWQTLAAA